MNTLERIEKFKKNLNCPLWNKCNNHECLHEAQLFGSCLWSVKVCVSVYDLWKNGLVKTNQFI